MGVYENKLMPSFVPVVLSPFSFLSRQLIDLSPDMHRPYGDYGYI